MSEIKRKATVIYSASKMFDLVNDIESYPSFLPWCGEAKILEKKEDEIKAIICIAKGNLKKSFTTVNRLQKDRMIEIRLIDGPFHHLEGFWKFQPLDSGCEVSLDMDYEFSNMLMGMMLGPVFGQIAGSFVDSFCKRAEDLFGKIV